MRPRMSVARCCCGGGVPPVTGYELILGNYRTDGGPGFDAFGPYVLWGYLGFAVPIESWQGYVHLATGLPVTTVSSAILRYQVGDPITGAQFLRLAEERNILGSPGNFARARIYGDLQADSPKPSSPADALARTRSAAFVDNVDFEWHEYFQVPSVELTWNVTSVVQELVNQGGWASGNRVTLLFDDDGSDIDYNAQLTKPDLSVPIPTGWTFRVELVVTP